VSDRTEAGLDELARMPPPVPPPPSAALEAELADLDPVAPRRPLRQLALMALGSLIYGAGVVSMLTMRRDVHELPMYWLLGAGLAWLAGFAVPLYLAMVPPRGSVMPRWKAAGIAAIVGAIGFVLLGLALHPSAPTSLAFGLDNYPDGYRCLPMGLATAIGPVVIGALFLRGTLPVGSRWVAAALGASGGSLGGLVLHLHCPITNALHVSVMHGSVVAFGALLAAALVPRAIELR
jgi:hypothetical protein